MDEKEIFIWSQFAATIEKWTFSIILSRKHTQNIIPVGIIQRYRAHAPGDKKIRRLSLIFPKRKMSARYHRASKESFDFSESRGLIRLFNKHTDAACFIIPVKEQARKICLHSFAIYSLSAFRAAHVYIHIHRLLYKNDNERKYIRRYIVHYHTYKPGPDSRIADCALLYTYGTNFKLLQREKTRTRAHAGIRRIRGRIEQTPQWKSLSDVEIIT